MTSRRPMTRTYSGNGRTNSFSEEEGSSSNGRSESRNTYLSDVRPENRSTLCTVMAQLTEDIQPSFDTTLKSKAVSENCNVKFSCVVSGYPAPELKWYKDDMEMDRYCGLPKYEIHRNGKTHTLQIYNCTLDDAAIYQVSASNSKGIVSCSGVLEVGTMNEYQIHQRFFGKLKQKAEKKKRDMEVQTKKEDEENIRKEKQLVSPERPPRKRHVQLPGEPPAVMEPEAVEKLGAAAEANGVGSEFMETAPLMNTVIDVNKETSPSEETLAKKKKITNGVDAEVNGSSSSRSLMMANGGENSYDGGMGLAQFLAETVQTQSDEEEQNYPQEEKPREINTLIVSSRKEQDKEQDWMRKERDEPEKTLQKESVREKRREEVTIEKEKENERPKAMSHTVTHTKHGSDVQHHSKAHKDPDHHNIQTSFSSMLHTVKGFFFGKSKKDTHDNADNKERAFDQVEKKEREFDCAPASTQAPKPEMPPSFQLQLYNNQASKPLTEDSTPMESGKIKKPSETLDIEKQSLPLEPHKHKHEDSVPATELPHVHKLSPENTELSSGQSVKEDDTVEDMEVSAGAERSGPGEDTSLSGPKVLTEADSQVVSVIQEIPIHQQSLDCLAVSPQPNNQARDEYSTREDDSVLPQTQPFEEEISPITTIISLEENWPELQSVVSASHSQGHEREDTECLQEEEMSVEVMGKEGEPDAVESCPLNICVEEEKAEVKSNKQPQADINRHETTELTTSSLEERIEPRKPITADQVLMPLFTEATNSPERNNVREEAEHTSLFQEMNIGFPPTVAPESLNKGDLKKQQECNSSIAKETMEGHTVSPIQCQNSDINGGGLTKGLISPSPTDLEVNVCCDKIIQTQASSEGERIEAKDDSVQFEAEQEKMAPVKGEEFAESKNLSVTLNFEGNAQVLEEDIIVTQHPSIDGQQVWPLDNFPQIYICTVEEIEDNTPILPDASPIEHFVIPKIEIMEPDYKECSPPLNIFALNKQKKDLSILQNHDATYVPEVIIQDQDVSMFDPRSLQPTQKGMQTDFNLPPRENVNKADETEMFEEPLVKSSEHLHQMDLKSIPVINVSFSEDKMNDAYVNTHVSKMPQPFESAVVTQYVVPPISITCHEGDSALSTQSESTGTDTSVVSETGTKHNVDNNLTTKPRKTEKREQDLEEIAEKMLKDQIPPMFYEDLMPKVGDNGSSVSKTTEDNNVPEILKAKPQTESNIENPLSLEDLQRNKPTVERLCTKPPAHPSLSPGSLRKFMLKASIESGTAMDPTIPGGDRQSDKGDDDRSGDSTPTSSRSCENSPCLKRRDSLTLIRSATPEELASGARRKIFMPKPKDEGDGAVSVGLDTQGKKESPYMSPGQARRAALLQSPTGQNTPPMEKRSPLMNRRKVTLEVSKVTEETPKEGPVSTKQEEKPVEKKRDPLKAPQVIRKIRGEPFPDASGHLKLWCQFFNVLSDSTIKWYRDEEEILELKRSGGDESQVALTIVLASSQDCGVYGCSISNEHGTDTTDYLLSIDILSEILLKGDLEVGEEIEMTPLIFTKGLADCGSWGDKYFGRIVTETVNIGEGYAHKAGRVRVIYGLDPIFESGAICIIKVQNPIAHGTKQESNLADRNGEITKQECKVQNMIREYCKIFAAEGRVIESFGYSLEVIPQYLMYRPANTVPYATAETDLKGDFLKYCTMDPTGRLFTQTASEVEQKCNTFQHWIHQWTHGNLLVTRLEGVETKITNVRVVTKSKGYQGLTEYGSPQVFEQFVTNHQCNYYCGLLGLKPLKSMDSLQPTTKTKGSRSPMLNRKSSPQLQRKGHSPQIHRKSNTSPKVTRKALEAEDDKSGPKTKPAETVDVIEIR